MRCLSLALALLFFAAQPGSTQDDAPFRAQSRLVQVPIAVTDAKGRTIDGLEVEDFILLDDGKRVERAAIDTIATGNAPIAIVIAVQSSGISTAALAKIHKVGAMIQPLITGDRGCAAVVSFASRVRWLTECTNDAAKITNAFAAFRPGEEKAGRMLDAMQEGIDRLKRRTGSRRILLLISETRDRGSQATLDATLKDAQTAAITVYAATYSAFKTAMTAKPSDTAPVYLPTAPTSPRAEAGSPEGREHIPIQPSAQRTDILGGLQELGRLSQPQTTLLFAQATGGTTFPFTRQKALEEAIEKLSAELHTQYVLSFAPAAAPETAASGTESYHRLEVRLARKGDFRIRARPGYWAGAARQ